MKCGVSKEFAAKQLMRLCKLPGFPKDEAVGLKELLGALMEAQDEAIAKAAMDHYLLNPTPGIVYCPIPPNLRFVIQELTSKEDRSAPLENCPICGGVGFRHVVVRGYEASEECPCRRRSSLTLVSKAG